MHLPEHVVAKRTAISPTSFEYTFLHQELGELGSVLFCAGLAGDYHLTHQLRRVPGDPLLEQRRALFEPILAAVSAQVSALHRA